MEQMVETIFRWGSGTDSERGARAAGIDQSGLLLSRRGLNMLVAAMTSETRREQRLRSQLNL
jgi:hypothetical protein